MILGVLLALITLAAIAALTRPWWGRAVAQRAISQRQANVAAYRLRIAELEQEVAAGNLEAAAAEALKLELQQRLLQDAATPDAPIEPHRSGVRPAIVIAVLLPLFAGTWYYLAGSWRSEQALERGEVATRADQAQAAQIASMVDRLAQRLKEQPDDAQGWAMLGRSYFVLKRYAEAAQAYERANALTHPADPELLVAQGGALGLAADGDLSGKPRELFGAALKLQPDNVRALWFAGQAAVQAGDYAEAQDDWERLLTQDLPEELRTDVEAGVRQLAQHTGRAAQIANASTPSGTAAEGPQLHIRVRLAPALDAKRKPGQVLYVFAKAAQGPPMPLAVQKLRPQSWPVEVTLDDSQAMAPALRLSQFDRWTVTARLGREGSPTAQPGDLQGRVTVARASLPKTVDVLISEEVQ